MNGTVIYSAEPCPCGHKGCRAANLRPVTFGQGVMPMEEATELARKLNAYPRLIEYVKGVGGPIGDALLHDLGESK